MAGKDIQLEFVLAGVEWIAENYPLQFRRAPIASWRARVKRLSWEESSHRALNQYCVLPAN